jgi:hypothetical protein
MPDNRLTTFVDWYSVWPGAVGFDKDGLGQLLESPRGVRLAVQKAETTGPVLQADRPWEDRLLWSCVLRNETRFQMWYLVNAIEYDPSKGQAKKGMNFDPMAGEFEGLKKRSFVCYAESDDGMIWRKPELGLHDFAGTSANNIVLPCKDDGLETVFRDRDGGYRMLIHDEPVPGGKSIWKAMRSLRSPDGIHWTFEDQPVLDMYCDTQNVGFYDERLGEYVCYVRYARGSRRAIGRTAGRELANLPDPSIVLEPDSQDPPTLDFYTPAYSRHPDYLDARRPEGFDRMGRSEAIQMHPDARDMHFMFPAMYHRDRDTLDVHLAVSRDGHQWSRPERKPIIPLGAEGSGAGATLYASPGIHVLEPDRWGVLYAASDQPHNMAFLPLDQTQPTTYRWACWPANRLVALQADSEGTCTVLLRGKACNELRLNYATHKGGTIRVELITFKGLWPPTGAESMEGYTFQDCDPLFGDSPSQPVTWNGHSALPSDSETDQTVLRLHMTQARLFAIEWD